jgi:protein-S-isoprenylcysteine O-methyltransferase Ste14
MRIQVRPAAPGARPGNLVRTLLQAALFWTVFFGLLPLGIVWLESTLGWERGRFHAAWTRLVGAGLFMLGGSLGLTSGIVMALRGDGTPLPLDSAQKLVVAGPYRYTRNPMAIGGLLQGVAVGLWLGSPSVVAYALAGAPFWHFVVRPWEEADLEQRFGAAYRDYRSKVHCWRIRYPGYIPPAVLPQ